MFSVIARTFAGHFMSRPAWMALAAALILPALAPQAAHAAPPCDMYCAAEAAGQGAVKLAAADEFTSVETSDDDKITPADGLRAAARRALGLEPSARRVAPSTLAADTLYLQFEHAAL